MIIIYIILAIIILFGIIRVIFKPYTNLSNLLLDFFFLDILGDVLGLLIDSIIDSWD